MKQFEIVFSRKCIPQSRIIKADRWEVRPANGITTDTDQIVFINDEYDSVVTRESVYDVKAVHDVTQAAAG